MQLNDKLFSSKNFLKMNSDIDLKCGLNHQLGYFFPLKTISKGIIARAISYMFVIYPEVYRYNRKIIDINTLKYWNNKYYPTYYEKERNLKILDIQGNINPFIKDPYLINKYL
jgi:endonuclease I